LQREFDKGLMQLQKIESACFDLLESRLQSMPWVLRRGYRGCQIFHACRYRTLEWFHRTWPEYRTAFRGKTALPLP
jgi:hypothetical protein